jgi:acyl carrier protein
MNKDKFLENFKDILQTEDNISLETKLEDIIEWDSLAKISTIAFLSNEFSKKVTFNEIQEFKTIMDIYNKVQG